MTQMVVDIVRVETTFEHGTFGVMLINREAFCCTLEPYEYDNRTNESCIPASQYQCIRHVSPKFGETFCVNHVPGRVFVLFHAGNRKEDTEGCILLGEHFGKLRENRAVLNSGKTFDKFMEAMTGIDRFRLSIHTPMWG